ncbi:hypothetical protein GCM10007880_53670 [Mesorhizobium amorphae]|nr:hypothetical protein GCM10007880_53670 [Mesorhizobium amorphae]
MGISGCDPIRFGLLFKRSTTRDRIGVGVADCATMPAGRHKVIRERIDGRETVDSPDKNWR